jgi:hypothetical protein
MLFIQQLRSAKKLNQFNMKRIFNYIFHSFTNSPEGFSARKLAAFTAVVTAVVSTFYFGHNEVVNELILIWLTFGLLCLGIITVQQIIEFKNGSTPPKEETKNESETQA